MEFSPSVLKLSFMYFKGEINKTGVRPATDLDQPEQDAEFRKGLIVSHNMPLLGNEEIGKAVTNAGKALKAYFNYLVIKLKEDTAQWVKGQSVIVKKRIDETAVKSTLRDAVIRDGVVELLKANTSLNYEKIRIKVEDGYVTLNGIVEWQFQQKPLIHSITLLDGVKGVTMRMTAFR